MYVFRAIWSLPVTSWWFMTCAAMSHAALPPSRSAHQGRQSALCAPSLHSLTLDQALLRALRNLDYWCCFWYDFSEIRLLPSQRHPLKTLQTYLSCSLVVRNTLTWPRPIRSTSALPPSYQSASKKTICDLISAALVCYSPPWSAWWSLSFS